MASGMTLLTGLCKWSLSAHFVKPTEVCIRYVDLRPNQTLQCNTLDVQNYLANVIPTSCSRGHDLLCMQLCTVYNAECQVEFKSTSDIKCDSQTPTQVETVCRLIRLPLRLHIHTSMFVGIAYF